MIRFPSFYRNRMLSAFTHVCPRLSESIEFKDIFTDKYIYKDLRRVAIRVGKIVDLCRWYKGNEVADGCFKLIPTVLTDEGFCFAFDALNSYDTYTEE